MPDDALDRTTGSSHRRDVGRRAVRPPIAELAALAADRRQPARSARRKLPETLEIRFAKESNHAYSTVAPVREGFHTITPFHRRSQRTGTDRFLEAHLGAQETSRHPHGERVRRRPLKSTIPISSSWEGESVRGQERIGAFHVYVPDCDATYNRAIEAGATSLGEPADRHLWRTGRICERRRRQPLVHRDASRSYPPLSEVFGTVTPFAASSKCAQVHRFPDEGLGRERTGCLRTWRSSDVRRGSHRRCRAGDGRIARLPTAERLLFVCRGLRCGLPARDRSRRDVALAAHRSGLGRPHRGTRGSLRLPVDAGHAHQGRALAHSARDKRYST